MTRPLPMWIPLVGAILLAGMPIRAAAGADRDACSTFREIIRADVKQAGRVCQVTVMRDLPVTLMGRRLSPEMMELSFHANFEPIGRQAAAVGEFALLPEEVDPVIDALRKGNLDLTALHNHMIGEQPRILFLHFQGTGDPAALAETVRLAIRAATAADKRPQQ